MAILIKNANILSMQANPYRGVYITPQPGVERTPMNDNPMVFGDILIEEDKITQVGTVSLLPFDKQVEIIDAKGMVAMPGLINGHNHSPMSLLRCFSDDLRLMEWLKDKMWPAEARMTPDDIYWGALLGIIEMIKSGTTAYADMYIHMDEIANAVSSSGMRASLARGLVFLEDDQGRRLREGIELVEKWEGKAEGRITTMLGPHAPYTCPPEQLKEVVAIAEQLEVPIHIHLAETQEETKEIYEKYRCSPTKYLAEQGMFRREGHTLLAHGIYLDDADISHLSGYNVGISHNPMSNLKLGCGIAKINKCLQEDINVGLGTDGPGSASSLDLFKEMKFAAALQKSTHGDPTVIDVRTVLEMATVNGAQLLGIEDQVGVLEPGKKADIILIDINQPHLIPHHNIPALIAYSATGADVNTTIINGKVVMRDRQLLTINEQEVIEQAQIRSKRIVEGV